LLDLDQPVRLIGERVRFLGKPVRFVGEQLRQLLARGRRSEEGGDDSKGLRVPELAFFNIRKGSFPDFVRRPVEQPEALPGPGALARDDAAR